MENFRKEELKEAFRAIASTIHKSQKVQETLSQKQSSGSSQLTTFSKKLKVFRTASLLITSAINEDYSNKYPREDLEETLKTIPSIIRQIEKIMPKFREGTSQHTLAVRRVKAFNIVSALAMRELNK